jgi:hypothetical protein
VPDLAFLDQVLHRPRHVFDRHIWVDTVLIVEVDGLDPVSDEEYGAAPFIDR